MPIFGEDLQYLKEQNDFLISYFRKFWHKILELRQKANINTFITQRH